MGGQSVTVQASLSEHPKRQSVSIPAGCQGIYFGQEREAL